VQQARDPRQVGRRGLGGRLVGDRLHVQPAGDLGGDLGAQRLLDRRLGNQRRHVRHEPVSVAHLVGAPHAEHRDGGEDAAEHDQHGGYWRAPAARALLPFPAGLGSFAAQTSDLGAQPLKLGALVFLGRRYWTPSLTTAGSGGRRCGGLPTRVRPFFVRVRPFFVRVRRFFVRARRDIRVRRARGTRDRRGRGLRARRLPRASRSVTAGAGCRAGSLAVLGQRSLLPP
jgi:hypothetical protein